MNAPIVPGHGFLFEGRSVRPSRSRSYGEETTDGAVFELEDERSGVATCRCGSTSAVLPSTAARQRWHKEHKRSLL